MTPLEEHVAPPAQDTQAPPTRPAAPIGRPGQWTVALFVAAFAFLLASFPARNGDLWMHLAAGRDIAAGKFAHALAPRPEAGQTWLFDLTAYLLYTALGGVGVALVKAGLVAGTALLILKLSGAGRLGWASVVCTILALLAMGTRLLLQPETVSYLFLALALTIVCRDAPVAEDRPPSWLPPWPLFVLFVVWANVDRWFVLGLVVVVLWWLGQARTAANGPRELGRRLVALVVLAAACLLNPAHVHAFVPPLELGHFSTAGIAATDLGRPISSPFQASYRTGWGLSSAGLAYYPLLGLGLLSFALTLPRWHWGRFLPWLGLALLSTAEARAIPMFAVLAGPVLAWNLHEFFAARGVAGLMAFGPITRFGLRGLAALLGLAFLACAWTGWLQIPPYEPRRWAVEAPPVLQRGAAEIARWHQDGQLGPDTRGLFLSPVAASAFAWFCPEERGTYDPQLAAAVRGDATAPDDWDRRLRAAGIHHVIVYDLNRNRLAAALGRLLSDPNQWPLIYQEGDLAVFGWRDPARAGAADPFRGRELNLNRLAFHPAADRQAPRQRPEAATQPRRWWDAFREPAPPKSIDRDEAAMYLLQADVLRRSAPGRRLAAWQESQLTGLATAAAGWTGVAGPALDARIRLELINPGLRAPTGDRPVADPPLARLAAAFMKGLAQQQDDAPSALVYLAIRAARRALAVNPHDAQAQLTLGQCYLMLVHGTRERAWGAVMPNLIQLRYAQASTALNQAIVLRPDLAQAHLSLAGLYEEMGFFDLALTHFHEYARLLRAAGPPPGTSTAQFRDRQAAMDQAVGQLADEVAKRENEYATAAAGVRVLDRAQIALQKKLGGRAREILLESDVSAFGQQGREMELNLLVKTGRARDVLDWTADSEQPSSPEMTTLYWLRTQAKAGLGDYVPAEEECARLALADWGEGKQQPREVLAALATQAVLDEQPTAGALPGLYWKFVGRGEFRTRALKLAGVLRQNADVTVLRGLLALEQGDVEEARVAFRLALVLWKDDATEFSGGGLDFSGRRVAQGGLALLK